MSFTLACSLISECKQDITTPREYKAPDLVFFPYFLFPCRRGNGRVSLRFPGERRPILVFLVLFNSLFPSPSGMTVTPFIKSCYGAV